MLYLRQVILIGVYQIQHEYVTLSHEFNKRSQKCSSKTDRKPEPDAAAIVEDVVELVRNIHAEKSPVILKIAGNMCI